MRFPDCSLQWNLQLPWYLRSHRGIVYETAPTLVRSACCPSWSARRCLSGRAGGERYRRIPASTHHRRQRSVRRSEDSVHPCRSGSSGFRGGWTAERRDVLPGSLSTCSGTAGRYKGIRLLCRCSGGGRSPGYSGLLLIPYRGLLIALLHKNYR